MHRRGPGCRRSPPVAATRHYLEAMTTPSSDDLLTASEVCVAALGPLVDLSWSPRAGALEWSCRQTVEHLCGLAYAPVLATRATELHPLALRVAPNAAIAELLWTTEAMAAVLAEVARAAPGSARAFHPAGRADPSGFVAMGIDELLVHTHDITTGLGAAFDPGSHLPRLILDRLFPWWPDREAEPWPALLWANGRIPLAGHATPGAEWLWHCAPIAEWNGTIPRWDPTNQRAVHPSPAEPKTPPS